MAKVKFRRYNLNPNYIEELKKLRPDYGLVIISSQLSVLSLRWKEFDLFFNEEANQKYLLDASHPYEELDYEMDMPDPTKRSTVTSASTSATTATAFTRNNNASITSTIVRVPAAITITTRTAARNHFINLEKSLDIAINSPIFDYAQNLFNSVSRNICMDPFNEMLNSNVKQIGPALAKIYVMLEGDLDVLELINQLYEIIPNSISNHHLTDDQRQAILQILIIDIYALASLTLNTPKYLQMLGSSITQFIYDCLKLDRPNDNYTIDDSGDRFANLLALFISKVQVQQLTEVAIASTVISDDVTASNTKANLLSPTAVTTTPLSLSLESTDLPSGFKLTSPEALQSFDEYLNSNIFARNYISFQAQTFTDVVETFEYIIELQRIFSDANLAVAIKNLIHACKQTLSTSEPYIFNVVRIFLLMLLPHVNRDEKSIRHNLSTNPTFHAKSIFLKLLDPGVMNSEEIVLIKNNSTVLEDFIKAVIRLDQFILDEQQRNLALCVANANTSSSASATTSSASESLTSSVLPWRDLLQRISIQQFINICSLNISVPSNLQRDNLYKEAYTAIQRMLTLMPNIQGIIEDIFSLSLQNYDQVILDDMLVRFLFCSYVFKDEAELDIVIRKNFFTSTISSNNQCSETQFAAASILINHLKQNASMQAQPLSEINRAPDLIASNPDAGKANTSAISPAAISTSNTSKISESTVAVTTSVLPWRKLLQRIDIQKFTNICSLNIRVPSHLQSDNLYNEAYSATQKMLSLIPNIHNLIEKVFSLSMRLHDQAVLDDMLVRFLFLSYIYRNDTELDTVRNNLFTSTSNHQCSETQFIAAAILSNTLKQIVNMSLNKEPVRNHCIVFGDLGQQQNQNLRANLIEQLVEKLNPEASNVSPDGEFYLLDRDQITHTTISNSRYTEGYPTLERMNFQNNNIAIIVINGDDVSERDTLEANVKEVVNTYRTHNSTGAIILVFQSQSHSGTNKTEFLGIAKLLDLKWYCFNPNEPSSIEKLASFIVETRYQQLAHPAPASSPSSTVLSNAYARVRGFLSLSISSPAPVTPEASTRQPPYQAPGARR